MKAWKRGVPKQREHKEPGFWLATPTGLGDFDVELIHHVCNKGRIGRGIATVCGSPDCYPERKVPVALVWWMPVSVPKGPKVKP